MANRSNTSPGNGRDALELQRHRSRKGVSLQQIADTTKISIRFLRAIEAGEFAVLPGGLFSRSYIRQYADAVGYDAAALLDRYQASFESRETDGGPPPMHRPPGREHRRSATLHWFRAISSIKL